MAKYFKNAPDGIPGNDDTGTMSAWLVFNMMGFYPDCPGEPAYTLSSPVFNRVTIHLDKEQWGRNELVIEAKRQLSTDIFINAITLGNKPFKGYRVSHEELLKGGNLTFELKSEPSR